MGGGAGGSFGNTRGASPKAVLDAISNVLTVASLIPGVDTFADLAAIPVDLLRGDYVSAGLDLVGAIPFIGEIADGAKTANRVVDAARTFDKASDSAKALKKAKKVTSVSDNARSVAKKYNLSKTGYFGEMGKNSRVFKSADPVKSSADFYKKISKGGTHSALSNGKGVQTVFEDGSRVVYRVVTKTPNSPAVNIEISIYSGIKKQKIHFIK